MKTLPAINGSHIKETLWIHRSDGTRSPVNPRWLRKYLELNPGLVKEMGLSFGKPEAAGLPRSSALPPVTVVLPPRSSTPPIPPGSGKAPDFLNAPRKYRPDPPAPIVAGKIYDLSSKK